MKEDESLSFLLFFGQSLILDVILGRSNLSIFEIPLSKLQSLGQVHKSAGEIWAQQNGKVKCIQNSTKFQGFPEIFQSFINTYRNSKGKTVICGMSMIKLVPKTEYRSVTFSQM